MCEPGLLTRAAGTSQTNRAICSSRASSPPRSFSRQHYDRYRRPLEPHTAAQYASTAASRGDASGRQRQQYGYSGRGILFAGYQAGGSPDGLDNAITSSGEVLMSRRRQRRQAHDRGTEVPGRAPACPLRPGPPRTGPAGKPETPNRARPGGRRLPGLPQAGPAADQCRQRGRVRGLKPGRGTRGGPAEHGRARASQPGSAAAAGAHCAAGLAIWALHEHQSASGELEDGIAPFQAAISLAADEDLRSGPPSSWPRALSCGTGGDQNVIDGLAQAGAPRASTATP